MYNKVDLCTQMFLDQSTTVDRKIKLLEDGQCIVKSVQQSNLELIVLSVMMLLIGIAFSVFFSILKGE